ncbi:hypothetical protein HYT53_06200 [Candidatus Woesearchaeota archaeon]|nr:hypothetical protein [Candidatus Woesearchaeota archaeon]
MENYRKIGFENALTKTNSIQPPSNPPRHPPQRENEDLNKRSILKKIMEMIGEHKYRISFVLITFVFVAVMAYLLITFNLNSTFKQIISNPINWVIIIIIVYIYKDIKPIVKQIWTQTEVRDDIEKETKNKLQLENEKLRLEIEILKQKSPSNSPR